MRPTRFLREEPARLVQFELRNQRIAYAALIAGLAGRTGVRVIRLDTRAKTAKQLAAEVTAELGQLSSPSAPER